MGLWWLVCACAPASALELPPIDRIVNYQPRQHLQVLTSDGMEIAQFGTERRVYVPLAQMPRLLQQAVLAVEDARFHEHTGIDPKGMARAVVAMLTGGRRQGASTITQQLVRTMLLTRELSAERKTKEILLALKVEQALSKDRILEIYLNEIYLGQRAYGFAAAARTYFGKPLDQLSLAEVALLAGLPQNPHHANPVASLDRAVKRQRIVLQRMQDTGVISAQQHAQAKAETLRLRPPGQRDVVADHVADLARQMVVDRFGEQAYTAGYRVVTALVAAEQQAAHEAVRRGLLAHAQRTPWSGPEGIEPLPPAHDPDLPHAATRALARYLDDTTFRVAIVLHSRRTEAELMLASGERIGLRGNALMPQVRPHGARPDALPRGAVVRVLAGTARAGGWTLAHWPTAEAALVALEPRTGRVRALVGGFDFQRQPFNHATQAWRQPGSTLKPLLVSAALESRIMPATLVDDLPFTAANGWRPDNSNHEHAGPLTLRAGLARSSNLVSVRVLQHVGVAPARAWLSRFGLEPERHPDNLTLALGTGSVTPLQLARAYATLASGGWRQEPVLIEKITDAQGRVVFEAPAAAPMNDETRQVPERNAFVVNSLLQDVTRHGTAARVHRQLQRNDLFGKTGTTDQAVDAWFAGHHASRAAVVWVGHSQPKSLGDGESGARLALPIWMDYMAAALRRLPEQPPPAAPQGVVDHHGDWLYTEWQSGGWVTQLSDTAGTVWATDASAPAASTPATLPPPAASATP